MPAPQEILASFLDIEVARYRVLLRCLILPGLLASMVVPAGAAETVRTVEASVEIADQKVLKVSHGIGEVRVLPLLESGRRVEVQAEVLCSRFNRRCRQWAGGVSIELRPRSESIALDLDTNQSRVFGGSMQVNLIIRVPEQLAIEIDLGVGRVSVDGRARLAGIDIDLGVGDVDLVLRERSVSSIRFEIGVGTARIEPRDGPARRSSFIVGSNDVGWRGDVGEAKVRVDIGVGAGRATLE